MTPTTTDAQIEAIRERHDGDNAYSPGPFDLLALFTSAHLDRATLLSALSIEKANAAALDKWLSTKNAVIDKLDAELAAAKAEHDALRRKLDQFLEDNYV